MKEKLSNAFLIIIFAAAIGYLMVTAVLDLTNKKDLKTVSVDRASEILEVEHSINGLIPIGKDHYYIGVSPNSNDAYIIKAPKSWYKKNFNSDMMSVNSDGVSVKALVREMPDFKVRNEINSRVSQIDGFKYPITTENYLDFSYKNIAILKIVIVALVVLLCISGVYIFKIRKDAGYKVIIAYFCVFVITAVLMFFVI